MRPSKMAFGVAAIAAAGALCAGAAGVGEVVHSGAYTLTLPFGLQASSAYVPDANPLSEPKIELGKLLYFDKRLSNDDTNSWATCHDPAHGFAEPRPVSQGIGSQRGGRNAPTVINRLFSQEQFWDGRAQDLEAQALGPITNAIEMGMPSSDVCAEKLGKVAGYAPRFAAAFGDPQISIARITQAIAAFERTVLSGNSPFDRYQAGDKGALSDSAVHGMAVFNGKGNCATCHAGFNFTDEGYHNLGVGVGAAQPDPGRAKISNRPEDTGAFKTPTLRNIVQTAPYMHDGSEATLEDVIAFYDRGGNPNPHLAKEIRPLGLTADERRDLRAFLEALTGDGPRVTPPTTFPQ